MRSWFAAGLSLSCLWVQQGSAEGFAGFNLEQRLALISFLATGQLGDLQGMGVSRKANPKNAKFFHYSFTTDGYSVVIQEPKAGASFQTLSLPDWEERGFLVGDALREYLTYAVDSQSPRPFGQSDEARIELTQQLFAIVEAAEKRNHVDSQRMMLLASPNLSFPLVQIFFRTGDHKSLRLFSWVLQSNPEVRHFFIHDHIENRHCLNFSARNLIEQNLEPGPKLRREIDYSLALLGGLVFDPLGWPPFFQNALLSVDQRKLLAYQTLESASAFLRRFESSLSAGARLMRELRPLEKKLLPHLAELKESVRHSATRLRWREPRHLLLNETSAAALIMERIRMILTRDSYYRLLIAPPGPTIPSKFCGRTFLGVPKLKHVGSSPH